MDLPQAVLVAAVFGGVLIGAAVGGIVGILIALTTIARRLTDIVTALEKRASRDW